MSALIGVGYWWPSSRNVVHMGTSISQLWKTICISAFAGEDDIVESDTFNVDGTIRSWCKFCIGSL